MRLFYQKSIYLSFLLQKLLPPTRVLLILYSRAAPMGRPPGSRSAAACRALGDNVLSAPRKRERTAVCVCEFGLSRAPPCRRDVTPDASD